MSYQLLTLGEVAEFVNQPMSRLIAGTYNTSGKFELVEYYKPIATCDAPLHYFVVKYNGKESDPYWTIVEAVDEYNKVQALLDSMLQTTTE